MTQGATKTRIALVQMRCGEDRDQNLEKALDAIRRAAADGADLVCLPELFLSPYFCKSEDHRHFQLAEPVPGPTTEVLESAAREHDVVVLASLFEKRTEGLYHNTLAVIDGPRGFVGKYRKMHIPDDPLFHEKFYFTPGDLGFRAFDTSAGRVGTLICWDQWYPEAARLVALQGASVIFYPTAIGWLPEEKADRGEAQLQAWETTQRAHAIANGCYVAAVNRIGFEPAPDGNGGIEFWGRSFVAAPDGTIIARASTDQEEILLADLDLGALDAFRTEWPFLRDRRIDAYGDLGKRFIDE
ncbi:MAG TPA: carbon-nitrogen hydrolase [Rhodothermales bacterium]